MVEAEAGGGAGGGAFDEEEGGAVGGGVGQAGGAGGGAVGGGPGEGVAVALGAAAGEEGHGGVEIFDGEAGGGGDGGGSLGHFGRKRAGAVDEMERGVGELEAGGLHPGERTGAVGGAAEHRGGRGCGGGEIRHRQHHVVEPVDHCHAG